MLSDTPRYRTNILVHGPYEVTGRDSVLDALPDRSIVLVSRGGRLVERTQSPARWEALGFRSRYDVDTGERAGIWAGVLPSATPDVPFRAEVRVRWRITDPVEVVGRELRFLAECERLVVAAVRERMLPVAAAYPVERVAEAWRHVRAAFASPHTLAEGITVRDVVARLSLPERPIQGTRRRERAAPAARQPTAGNAGLPPEMLELMAQAEPDSRDLRSAKARIAESGQVAGTSSEGRAPGSRGPVSPRERARNRLPPESLLPPIEPPANPDDPPANPPGDEGGS